MDKAQWPFDLFPEPPILKNMKLKPPVTQDNHFLTQEQKTAVKIESTANRPKVSQNSPSLKRLKTQKIAKIAPSTKSISPDDKLPIKSKKLQANFN